MQFSIFQLWKIYQWFINKFKLKPILSSLSIRSSPITRVLPWIITWLPPLAIARILFGPSLVSSHGSSSITLVRPVSTVSSTHTWDLPSQAKTKQNCEKIDIFESFISNLIIFPKQSDLYFQQEEIEAIYVNLTTHDEIFHNILLNHLIFRLCKIIKYNKMLRMLL